MYYIGQSENLTKNIILNHSRLIFSSPATIWESDRVSDTWEHVLYDHVWSWKAAYCMQGLSQPGWWSGPGPGRMVGEEPLRSESIISRTCLTITPAMLRNIALCRTHCLLLLPSQTDTPVTLGLGMLPWKNMPQLT